MEDRRSIATRLGVLLLLASLVFMRTLGAAWPWVALAGAALVAVDAIRAIVHLTRR